MKIIMKNSFLASYWVLGTAILLGLNGCAPKLDSHFIPSSKFYHSTLQPDTLFYGQGGKKKETIGNTRSYMIDRSLTPELEKKEKIGPMPVAELTASADKEQAMIPGASISRIMAEHKAKIEKIEASRETTKNKTKSLRKEARETKKKVKQEFKKQVKALKKNNDRDEYALMMILAFLIPPLGIGLTYGIQTEFWLSLVLTLVFIIPGIIYSMIKVHRYYRG